jgi:hypothetical protein
VDFLGKIYFLNANVQSHGVSSCSFLYKATLTRAHPARK